jgi:hypothetical protein
MRKLALLTVVIALVLGLGSCALFNKAPFVVLVYDDYDLYDGGQVFFDASSSSDPENDDLEFAWSIVSAPGGSTAVFESPDSPGSWFRPLIEGTYTIKLTVTDGTNTVEGTTSFSVSGGV